VVPTEYLQPPLRPAALALGGTGVVVRVGWNDQAMIMRALDTGAKQPSVRKIKSS
jgi:2-keto-3-deoxy-L-rhamnonate aldolase RhmA